jgi:hypothetical protein
MAILIRGTPCRICNLTIAGKDPVVGFSPFVGNELDPLFFFSDGAFHQNCFDGHPLGGEALERHELIQRTGADRKCAFCAREILDPDDYFIFDYFTPADGELLSRWSRSVFHLCCLSKWGEGNAVHRLLLDLKRSGRWKGGSIDYMLEVMHSQVGP